MGTKLVAVEQILDPSLINLTSEEESEYDEGQTDWLKTSTLRYGDTIIWQTSSTRACHIGGWGGSNHTVALSADKTTFIVMSGIVQNGSGEMYSESDKFAP